MGISASLALLPALAVTVTGVLLIVLRARRRRMVVLGIQYLCVAWLVTLDLPMGVALARLTAGVVATAILSVSVLSVQREAVGAGVSGRQPHALTWVAGGLVGVACLALGSSGWGGLPGVGRATTIGSTALLGLGLLQVGMADTSLRVGLGLLTAVSGFELVYGELEPSLAVTALLGSVHIGIALVVSYLLRGLPADGEE